MDIKSITCPQCGSTDIKMLSDSLAQCSFCDTTVAVKKTAKHERTVDEETPLIEHSVILTQYSKKEFLRKVWISLAEEGAPLEAFREDFSDVCQTEHQVYVETISADMTYQASIGYDREEPYITTQKYQEKVGDKWVWKERPVTKYRTVTDWSPLHGEHREHSIAFAENDPAVYFDKGLFLDSYFSVPDSSLVSAPAQRQVEVSEDAYLTAAIEHQEYLFDSIKRSLPGDHAKDIDYKIKKISVSGASIYFAQEYEASICINGNTYTKRAFPFGEMKIGGDRFDNEDSLDAIIRHKRDDIPKIVWNQTKIISLLTIALLVLSIAVSCFVHYISLVIISFAAAAASFILNTFLVSNATDKAEAEISDFERNYKLELQRLLNDKLASLGLKPIGAAEA